MIFQKFFAEGCSQSPRQKNFYFKKPSLPRALVIALGKKTFFFLFFCIYIHIYISSTPDKNIFAEGLTDGPRQSMTSLGCRDPKGKICQEHLCR
jgi:hypothetical protein